MSKTKILFFTTSSVMILIALLSFVMKNIGESILIHWLFAINIFSIIFVTIRIIMVSFFYYKKKYNFKKVIRWFVCLLFFIIFYIIYFKLIFPYLIIEELKKECFLIEKEKIEKCVENKVYEMGKEIKERYLKDDVDSIFLF